MKFLAVLFCFLYSAGAWALTAPPTLKDDAGKSVPVYLTDHEPNILGLRYDRDDDDMFLDFKISLQYPLFKGLFDWVAAAEWNPESLKSICKNKLFDDCYPYLAFTGRFAQYIDMGSYGRESSPVVSKRFNPKVFWRFEKNQRYYVDLEYGHESNGQSTSDQPGFDALADQLEQRDKGERSHANDYISRGWDYWGITAKYIPQRIHGRKLSLYLSMARYIGGIFQGDIEEYYPDFEPPRDITERQQVNGIRLMAKWKEDRKYFSWLGGYKIAVIYETGLEDTGKYNTAQLEMSTRLFDIPVMLWLRNGYSNNLAEYYKEMFSMGIALELRTFE